MRDRARWHGRDSVCKSCRCLERQQRETPEAVATRNARRKAWREANLERERAKRQAAYAASPEGQRALSQARRAAKRGAPGDPFEDVEIFQRDGWTCGLCLEGIDHELRWPDPGSASLDHVIPLSRGGAHSRANVQAAHLGCNLSKGNRATAAT